MCLILSPLILLYLYSMFKKCVLRMDSQGMGMFDPMMPPSGGGGTNGQQQQQHHQQMQMQHQQQNHFNSNMRNGIKNFF